MAKVEVIYGDALVEIPRLLERGVKAELCATDPPFGISDAPLGARNMVGKREGKENTWHPASEWDKAFDPEWCAAACSVSAVVAWFGSWKRRADVEAAMRYPVRQEVVWAKDCHVTPPAPLCAMRDERIWIFSQDSPKARTFETTVWDEPIIPTWEYKHHKNEKPVALMRRLIRFLTDPGDLVVDPFAGSFSTGVACVVEGRDFIGIEQSAYYCAIGEARMKRAQGIPADIPRPIKRHMETPLFP